tara:strand:- start:1869 stop:2999 length:1131 start_codon:yes stop_codon:yes gene_type:complete
MLAKKNLNDTYPLNDPIIFKLNPFLLSNGHINFDKFIDSLIDERVIKQVCHFDRDKSISIKQKPQVRKQKKQKKIKDNNDISIKPDSRNSNVSGDLSDRSLVIGSKYPLVDKLEHGEDSSGYERKRSDFKDKSLELSLRSNKDRAESFDSYRKHGYNLRRRSGSIDSYKFSSSFESTSDSKKFKRIYAYVENGCNIDKRTQQEPNGKGASSVIWSYRRCPFSNSKNKRDTCCILLGLEKHDERYKRKYAGTFNLFGGGFESVKGDVYPHDTVVRELEEEFGPAILKRINWCGSPWAYNQTYIEFGTVSANFCISKAFRENDEMKEATWFPVENILNSRKNMDTKSFMVMDLYGNEREVSLYAHGVVCAMSKNGHIR